MMDIIFKNQQFLLWKYMETLTGEGLNLLITTLKCDFVYEEDVSSVHYATLMETHIDKIFRNILTTEQFQEAQRGFLDLHLYYLSRMNHVPPHIGPRLSHLCFLICQKYELENPYLGVDDWVLMRHHLKAIKDVVTDWSFTVASESQYRAPITLEKIFQAAIIDNMLELLFKDFMSLLLAICNHNNSKKCKRLFLAYQTALFQQIDIDNMEVQPDWMFDQCITTLTQVASTNGIVTHMEHMIIAAEHDCLLKFTDLTRCKKEKWQKLLENYLVSGRCLLVKEAACLLESRVLVDEDVFNWKENLSQAKLLIDIISDLPKSFLQDDEDSTVVDTIESYVTFLLSLITQLRSADLLSKVQENIHKCVMKCLAKDPLIKARLAALCVQEDIINFQDMNFLRELMFCVDKLLKDDDCLTVNETLSSTVESLITGGLNTCREKGYIPVDFNSLMLSVCLTCISGDGYIQTDTTGPPYDIYLVLYNSVVLQFIRMHQTNGTLRLISNIVPQVIQLVHEGIEQGTSFARCVTFLQWLGTSCPEVIVGHCPAVIELFLDWECFSEIYPLIPVVYPTDPLSVVSKVPDLFDKLKSVGQTDRQTIIAVLHLVVENHAEVFSSEHISQLVSMYKNETTPSQQMILQIIHRVAVHYPAKVFGCYPHLTDDAKFPLTSLKDRAPILAALTQHNEDLAKKTTDYLMTHVANKDIGVSLVAMETLEPMLKQSPTCLMKHKQKLKSVERTSNCQRVKEICRGLAPDTQPKGPRNVQKGNKLTTKEPEVSKTSFQKNSLQYKMSTMVTSEGGTQSQKSAETSPKKQSEAEKVMQTDFHNTVSRLETNANSGSSNLEVKVSDETGDFRDQSRTVIVLTINSSEKETVVSDDSGSGLDSSTDTTTQASKTENANTGSVFMDTNLCLSGAKVSSKMTGSQSQNTEGNLKHSDNENRMAQAKEVWTEKVHAEPSDMLVSLGNSLNSEKNGETVIDTNSVESNGLNDLELEKPPIYLSFHQSCRSQVSMLRRHLKMAGYECWVDTGQTRSGDGELHAGIQEVKVVVCCLNDQFISSQECCKEVAEAVNTSKPVIPLRFQPLSSCTSLLKDHLAIRFYMKPGEVKVTMGFWAEHKFHELLMRLNYLQILPDDKIITKAYENWWLPRQQADTEVNAGKEDVRPVSAPYFPNVFISYDWGKQHQVKTLYEELTNFGYSCWLGVYQMSGSESLYNKITQGLHGCRVVLACVTKKYTRAENCQQEVRLAHSLKRPIIPLLLEEVRWPLEDEIGTILKQYDCIKLGKGQGKKVFKDVQFENLVLRINLYVPNAKLEETKSSEQNGDGDKPGPKGEMTLNQEALDGRLNESKSVVFEQIPDNDKTVKIVHLSELDERQNNRKTIQKSSSMFEIEKASRVMTVNSNRPVMSKTDDDLLVKKPIPEGVIVDEMGYTVKSSRSKSCVLL